MAGWHHRLHGRESEWTPGVGDGQGGLACCNKWGRKESDTTERLNWTDTTKLSTVEETQNLWGYHEDHLALRFSHYVPWNYTISWRHIRTIVGTKRGGQAGGTWDFRITGELVAQSCPTLCNPMDCSLPGSSVLEILQANIESGLPLSPPEHLQGSNPCLLHCRQVSEL